MSAPDSLPSTGRFYGGFGLAIVIAELATHRAAGRGDCRVFLKVENTGPLLREEAFSDEWVASQEYYRICDRITRGEKP